MSNLKILNCLDKSLVAVLLNIPSYMLLIAYMLPKLEHLVQQSQLCLLLSIIHSNFCFL